MYISVSKSFPLVILHMLLFHNSTLAQPLYKDCFDTANYTSNSLFETNLKILLRSLPVNASLNNNFANTTIGSNPDQVYGLGLCRGDLGAQICRNCLRQASQDVIEVCPNKKGVLIWYEFCMLRYTSNQTSISIEFPPMVLLYNNRSNSEPNETNLSAGALLYPLVDKAPTQPLMFAIGDNEPEKVYGLVQCSRDLSVESCRRCLVKQMEYAAVCCERKRTWRLLGSSCTIIYEGYAGYGVVPPPGPTPVSEPEPPTVTPREGDDTNPRSKVSTKAMVLITAAAFLGMSVMITFVYYYLRGRKKQQKVKVEISEGILLNDLRPTNTVLLQDNIQGMNSMQSQDLSFIDLDTVVVATNNFSQENKLGEGGFGPVYKGILPNGREIAVKRLLQSSGQGEEQFKNEVILIAKLQHRNLVRLLHCCIERKEKLLIYEYMPNTSLDVFLFDKIKCMQLDWQRRHNIVIGIARGILYLHEDSRLRVVHRDLKASNVLLDDEMNPKISDFGMAKIFGGNQCQANTNRVVGTYGYMAPEYAMHGLFSVKSDVFSFGVLLLEIISGKRNNRFIFMEQSQSLLTYAWKLWSNGQGLELLDPLIVESSSASDVLRCIQIGLLCVQEDGADRPTMSSVVLMLGSEYAVLPQPTRPALYAGRLASVSDGASTSDKKLSINDVTVSSIHPR